MTQRDILSPRSWAAMLLLSSHASRPSRRVYAHTEADVKLLDGGIDGRAQRPFENAEPVSINAIIIDLPEQRIPAASAAAGTVQPSLSIGWTNDRARAD